VCFFSSRRRHTRWPRDWSSDVCSSDLATGDQQSAGARAILNYQYRNRFAIDDYVATAELYRKLRPNLIVGGHWAPQEVDDAWLERLGEDALRVADLHRALLPDGGNGALGATGFAARIEPYRTTIHA